MERTLYVASSNAGKLRDFAAAAEADGVRVLPLPGLDEIPPPPEDEPTFEGNACAKAVYYSRLLPEELVIADDSGLEVDALDGAPGVHSARYAARLAGTERGPKPAADLSVDVRNNLAVLKNLASTPADRRGARYRCVLAAARGGEVLVTAEGSVAGQILTAPRGTGGFGYDPLFYVPELKRTMAEIDLETKHAISHRGRAFRVLRERLETLLR